LNIRLLNTTGSITLSHMPSSKK